MTAKFKRFYNPTKFQPKPAELKHTMYIDITNAEDVCSAISGERGVSFVSGVVRNKGSFWVTYFGVDKEAVAQRYLEDIQMDGNLDHIMESVDYDERHGIYNLCAKVIAEGEYAL